MKAALVACVLACCWAGATFAASDAPVETYGRIAPVQGTVGEERRVALTLDACSGAFDADLLQLLVRERIPATVFATRRWIERNPQGVEVLKAHPDLFEVEDHGARHVAAVIGRGRKIFGVEGEPDLAHLRDEVQGGADAITRTFGTTPRWYRGATARYDSAALGEIRRLGYQVAGFSVNGDAGATLGRQQVAARLLAVRGGDVVIAHLNRPASGTAEGLSDSLPVLLRRGFVFTRLDQVVISEQRVQGR